MRKTFILSALLCLLIVGIFTWRHINPPLTDEQQIAAAINAISAAANARSPRGVANYLAKDFKFGSTSKSEFQNFLVGAMLQHRVVNLQTSSVKVEVNGETATSGGHYVLSLKPEFDSPPEVLSGRFGLEWRKIDGEWVVVRAQGEHQPN